jgi:hypothetical protein
MGKNNKARRAAKSKQKARRRAQGEAGRTGPGPRDDHPGSAGSPGSPGSADSSVGPAALAEIARMTAAGVDTGVAGTTPRMGLDRLAGLPHPVVLDSAETILRRHVPRLWDHGWQPAELHRQARISGPSRVGTRLAEHAVSIELTRLLATSTELHPDWRAQAEELSYGPGGVSGGWLTEWESVNGEGYPRESYAVIASVIRLLYSMPPIEPILPAPGQRAAPGTPTSRTPDPVLERVRGLLAKAESTEFEAEATALTAKAQELITRHAIDVALLSAETGTQSSQPTMIRVPIDPPYADAKSLLIQVVAEATRCRTVFSQLMSSSSVVGLPGDLAAVEILFTSLLVQAQHAMTEAGQHAPPGSQPRSQSFRSAFLLSYARRIKERLAEINKHVFSDAERESSSFLPVLRSQEEAVADFVAKQFPDTVNGSIRGGYNRSGWVSGRIAADQAQLTAGRLDTPA